MASEQDNTQPASSHLTTAARWRRWRGLSVQAQFEHVIVLFLSALIAVVVALTVWSLALKVLAILLQSNSFAAADPTVFQSLFGMMFTVIIALEFRRTLLVITERQQSIVHVRAVVLIAMLAIVRKLIIFDLPAERPSSCLLLLRPSWHWAECTGSFGTGRHVTRRRQTDVPCDARSAGHGMCG